jgi:hypothetical protein
VLNKTFRKATGFFVVSLTIFLIMSLQQYRAPLPVELPAASFYGMCRIEKMGRMIDPHCRTRMMRASDGAF